MEELGVCLLSSQYPHFFIATCCVGAGAGCESFLAISNFALTVNVTTSGFTALGSTGSGALVPAGVCAAATVFAASRVVSMLRLLNKPFENSRLWPNLVTEYSFGDS